MHSSPVWPGTASQRWDDGATASGLAPTASISTWRAIWTTGGAPIRSGAAVLAAAVTKLDACERDPEATARVNVEANLALAAMLASQGVYVVFLSSNQVFDGTRPHRLGSEPTSPQTVYGRQKAEVESRLLARTTRPPSCG